jgi:chemotaxis protein methyltransferase CheR
MTDAEYTALKKRINELLTIDIDAYKTQQMRRRLESFVSRRAGTSVAAFYRNLHLDADALEELRNMLTINVSEFFRDAAQFERLRAAVLPDLLANGGRKLKIWSAACSHGEEPYSVAIILHELGALHRASILATDIDRVVLAKARAGGPYTAADLRNARPAEIREYFTTDGAAYTVVDTLRRRVDFRELNLLADRFDTGFDLIICRNVMIYFSEETKQRLFEGFYRSLTAAGVLFLGGTEALIGSESRGFERLGGNFYRKAADTAAAERPKLTA